MNGDNQVRTGALRLSTVATSTRQTPKTDFGTVMRNGLIQAGSIAADGLQRAAPYIPGGAIISAALSGATPAAQMAGGGGGTAPTYAVQSSAITAGGGGGPVGGGTSPVGSFGGTGILTLPDRRPNLGTDLSNPAAATGGGINTQVTPTDSFNQMMAATRSMTEFQASFNLQYLQLQEKIQMDTRQFNLISNIMKTKHDAAKNALNNVR